MPDLDPVALWTRRLTYATAVVGIATAAFSGLQWHDLQQSVEDAKKAAEIAKTQAEAAKTQAEATHDVALSIKQQTELFLREQRPYVSASEGAVDFFELGRKLTSYVRVKNYGKPAAIYHYEINRTYSSENLHQILSDDGRQQYEPDCRNSDLSEMSNAKNHVSLIGVIFPTEERPVKTTTEIVIDDEMMSGAKAYVRIDCLIYKFTDGIKHTLSCYNIKAPLPPKPISPPQLYVAEPKARMNACDAAAFSD